jgi:hypothetical protein
MTEAPIGDPFELRHAATDRATIVNVPERWLLAIDGVGSPDADDYRLAGQVLRTALANVSARLRRLGWTGQPTRVLETAWWIHPEVPPDQTAEAFKDRRVWHWQQMIELPLAATEDDVESAIDQTRREAGRVVPLLRTVHFVEGVSAQILHVGASPVDEAVRRLYDAVAAQGLEPRGHLHELRLAEAQAVPQGRERSILRLPVEPLPATPAGQYAENAAHD